MQLYALRFDVEPAPIPLATALHRAAAAFPELEHCEVTRDLSPSGRLELCTISHPPGMAFPRVYRARRGDRVALYDGLPGHPAWPVHDADVLLDRWRDVHGELAGVFSALHVDLARDCVQCVTDPLALAQVYVHRSSGGWILSNSVATLRTVAGIDAMDHLAVASMLTVGWAVGDRTLLADVSVLPGGHVHRFAQERLVSEPYLTPAVLAADRTGPKDATQLAQALVANTRAVSTGCDVAVRCGVTAGRDSRVVAGLLGAAGVEAEYYTTGEPGDPDVEIARAVTLRLKSTHQLFQPRTPTVSDWLETTERFVRQTDGMASLSGIADWLENQRPVPRVGLKAWGIGGEIGRAAVGIGTAVAANAWGIRSSTAVQRAILARKTRHRDGVALENASRRTAAFFDLFIQTRLAEGWPTREVLEAYYAFERVRHWAAAGVRRASATSDVYSPFVSREFISYAFSLSPEARYLERPHRALLQLTAPALLDVPFEKPWRSGPPALVPARVLLDGARAARRSRKAPPRRVRGGFEQFGHAWFEAGIPVIREVVAGMPASPVWEYVDRDRFQRLLESDPQERLPHLDVLCRALTALWFLHRPGTT